MDRELLQLSNSSEVVVLAGAARVGDDYAGAAQRAVRHYERLGVSCRGVADPRVDLTAALTDLDGLGVVDGAAMVVLPGGSPASLLTVLNDVGDGRVGARLRELWESGTAVSGASAGAMVLCAQMVRPDRGDVVDGLGFADGLALPHWKPGSNRGWAVPDVLLWGLPECGGVVIHDDTVLAVGAGEPSRFVDGVWSAIDR